VRAILKFSLEIAWTLTIEVFQKEFQQGHGGSASRCKDHLFAGKFAQRVSGEKEHASHTPGSAYGDIRDKPIGFGTSSVFKRRNQGQIELALRKGLVEGRGMILNQVPASCLRGLFEAKEKRSCVQIRDNTYSERHRCPKIAHKNPS
jgi:hypothetical protein